MIVLTHIILQIHTERENPSSKRVYRKRIKLDQLELVRGSDYVVTRYMRNWYFETKCLDFDDDARAREDRLWRECTCCSSVEFENI